MNPVFLKRHWPLIGILLLLILVVFYWLHSGRHGSDSPMYSDFISREGFRLEDIHYTQDDPEEGIKWILDAREARISKDRKFISFKYFRLKLEPNDRPSIEIEGERGVFDKDSGQINLRENLKGRTENGYRIATDHVMYQQKEGYLKGESAVTIFGPSFTLEGRGLYVDLKREYLSLDADVKAVIKQEALTL